MEENLGIKRTLQTSVVVGILTSAWLLLVSQPAQACNLVPNSSFEQGSGASFDDWAYKQWTGSGSLQGSSYPGDLQSGSRAAVVNVSQPGAVVLRTVPESSAMAVSANTSYTASARLLSSNGAMAGLWVVEYNNGMVVLGTFLGNGGGSGDWETLESTFTTQPTTTHIGLRLVHHISAGQFVWDDVAIWQTVNGQRCVDVRHYVFQTTPGFKLCNGNVYSSICIDGHQHPNSEFYSEYSNGIRDIYAHNGDGSPPIWVGIHKNLDAANWRCFADQGDQCGNSDGTNAEYPPGSMPLNGMLPVLNTTPSNTGVTPGAQAVFSWQRGDVRIMDWFDGAQGGVIGPIWRRAWWYVLEQFDFGGDVGLQSNVLVAEFEATGVNPLGFTGGERLERYFFVPGFGRLKQSGREDTDCRLNHDALSCEGTYDLLTGFNTFNINRSGDFSFTMDVPWNDPGWW